MEVQYPDIDVRLSGTDGNVFAIIGRVQKAIRRAKDGKAADAFGVAAHGCGSYDEVLQLCMRTVNVS